MQSPHPALLALSFLLPSCTHHMRNMSACQALRQNHERIMEIDTTLARLASEPPSGKRDQRMAHLEKRRRMYLDDNDRQQPLCHPVGEDRPQDPFIEDLHPLDPRR